MNNKGHITLVEVMIIVAIFGLLAAIAIPGITKARKAREAINKATTQLEKNETMLKEHEVKKLFEIKGYDVYVFRDGRGYYQSVAIPTTNSVYDLERR